MSALAEKGRAAFGRFEADLQSGELWQGSVRIHLPAQPFKILRILLECAGEVVTKEQLQAGVWEKNTNVDFERAIAGSINKLRDALGDSAVDPRYIETLPKRGYRFVAEVRMLEQDSPASSTSPFLSIPLAISTPQVAAAPSEVPDPWKIREADYIPGGEAEPVPITRDSTAVLARIAPAKKTATVRFLIAIALAFALAETAALVWLLARPTPVQPEINQITYDNPMSAGPPNPDNLPMLVTDGAFLYGTARINGKPTLAAISPGTGNIEPLKVVEAFRSSTVLDIARDGSDLLVSRGLDSSVEQPLWIVPTSGGAALRVGSVMTHGATWMPDNTSILYAFGNDLWVVRVTDGVSTHLLTLPGAAFWPRWSPDGKTLRFTLIDPNTHQSSIWQLRRGAKFAHPFTELSDNGSQVCCGVWSGDNKSYVFQRFRDRGIDLWELSTSFGVDHLLRLTSGPGRYFSPVTDRSGGRVFFLGTDDHTTMQRFDRAQRTIVPAPAFLQNATRVEYSADGMSVAWTDGDGILSRANAADGSNRLQLTPREYEVFAAHWSPDGTELALMARKPGEPWALYVESANGGQIGLLLRENRNVADPGWSPDGKQIVFGREPDLMGKDKGPRQLYVLDVSSKNVRPLDGSTGLFSPRWSPDGKWIAALSLDQRKVMLYNVETRAWSLLEDSSAADPVWARDSKSLYVHDFLSENQPILRIAIPSGEKESVTDLRDLHATNAENYFFAGLTPADDPLVLPRVGTSNLYSLRLP